MKISVIALDYDGTIATRDQLDSSVRDAIAAARTQGIRVVLVTGRILDDLRRVAGDLHFVDGVVAENGAVVHLPGSGHTAVLAPRIPQSFVDELGRRGVSCGVGRCLVEAAAPEAPRLLDALRALELPLVLVFNAGRVMVTAQGVSKATGLHVLLDTLRLSARNTLAIGDAENDHELLRLAEVGCAVEWGSAALRAAADVIIRGAGPKAVADYVRQLSRDGRIPIPLRARRLLRLGYLEDGREFALGVKGRNVLVAGDAKSGKSWVAGMLCEQLILHGYSLCVLDPEGDYVALEALPGVMVLGGEDPLPTPRDLLRVFRHPDHSVVIDVSRHPHEEKIAYIRALLPVLNIMRQRTGFPHRILIDEAHYFLHDAEASQLLDLERNGYIVATYCASRLPKELLAKTEVMLVTCESNPAEIEALAERCATCHAVDRSQWALLSHLRTGQAVALPITDEAGGELRLFTVGPRVTRHVRHREKYVDVPVAEYRAFVFGSNGQPHRVRTLRQLVGELEGRPRRVLEPYLRRGDFSRWIRDVFGDHPLAAELRGLEDRHRSTPQPDTLPDMARAIRARYDLMSDTPPEALV